MLEIRRRPWRHGGEKAAAVDHHSRARSLISETKGQMLAHRCEGLLMNELFEREADTRRSMVPREGCRATGRLRGEGHKFLWAR